MDSNSLALIKVLMLCSFSILWQIYRKINIRVVLSALEIWTDKDHIPFVKRAGEDLRNLENHPLSNQAGVAYDSIHLLRWEKDDLKCQSPLSLSSSSDGVFRPRFGLRQEAKKNAFNLTLMYNLLISFLVFYN